jgi:membrane fusion protein, multidrug efflux system
MNDMAESLKSRLALIGLVVLLIVGAIGYYVYVRYRDTHISTDDAYVTGRIHVIASKVPGTVKAVMAHDNQFVKQGAILLSIDERDYDVRVKEVASAVAAEKAKLDEIASRVDVSGKQLTEFRFRVESAKANLKLQEINLRQAAIDLQRAEKLFGKKIIAEERYDKVKTAYEGAAAQVDAAREQLKQAEAALDTQKSLIKQMESSYTSQGSFVKQKRESLAAESLKKSYTVIYAPSDGYVTKKNLEVGNQIQVGQPLMAIVPLDDVWVVANYKETQLERVRPGQKVTINVDSYPGKTFNGKVQSIMAGSGTVFSLFPPENATGNYVKVVQRIPVKIVLEQGTDPEHILRVGMSVEPTVLVE